jgi:hypothetical protein
MITAVDKVLAIILFQYSVFLLWLELLSWLLLRRAGGLHNIPGRGFIFCVLLLFADLTIVFTTLPYNYCIVIMADLAFSHIRTRMLTSQELHIFVVSTFRNYLYAIAILNFHHYPPPLPNWTPQHLHHPNTPSPANHHHHHPAHAAGFLPLSLSTPALELAFQRRIVGVGMIRRLA